jgi:hypothetical protein
MTGDEFLKQANELAKQHGENIDPLHQLIIKLGFDLTNCQKENEALKAAYEELKKNAPTYCDCRGGTIDGITKVYVPTVESK